ncbi:hypothetical protein JD969_11390 [Planctomycetota bacterium]|nr:hypothetical protein JD969_11390 [Planctomycetota bacterium]
MASTYQAKLHEAQERSFRKFEEIFTPKFKYSKTKQQHNPDDIKSLLVDDFKDFIEHSAQLSGSCFKIARKASYVLHENFYRHTLTIGNVSVDNKPYYATTIDSIENEIEEGFVPSKDAIAHAWLTLDSGLVVDLTILASLAFNVKKIQDCIGIENAILVYDPEEKGSIVHHPMFTGFGYHFYVVTHPLELNYAMYEKWLNDYYLYWNNWKNSKYSWK